MVGRFLRVTGLSIFDHAAGRGFGLARGVLIAVALIMGIMAFSPSGRPPASVVEFADGALRGGCGARRSRRWRPHELREGFRKTYAQVKSAWEKTLEDGIRKLARRGKETE